DELTKKVGRHTKDGARARYRQEPGDGHACATTQPPEKAPAGGGIFKRLHQPPKIIVYTEVRARFKCGGIRSYFSWVKNLFSKHFHFVSCYYYVT
ncbi:hypothetical protein PIB30_111738, partial [Stylosanthes scabra]|nr:hypothetical protein [Stylosanthes scabra]